MASLSIHLKNKIIRGFTLIEMLITITVLGIVMPLLFNVINSSFKELRKMESIQMKNIIESRLINRLEEDFRTHTNFNFMTRDSISYYTIRNHSFQQEIAYFIENGSILYRLDNFPKKVLVSNVDMNETYFQFLNYDGTIKEPNNDSFNTPEMNTMQKIGLNYRFTVGDDIVTNTYLKIRRMN
mgnify:CR=1 FL=1